MARVMTNAEFVAAVNARFGRESVFFDCGCSNSGDIGNGSGNNGSGNNGGSGNGSGNSGCCNNGAISSNCNDGALNDRPRKIDAARAFRLVTSLIDIEPYRRILEGVSDQRLQSFLRFLVASVRRHDHVPQPVVEAMTAVLADKGADAAAVQAQAVLEVLVDSQEAQIACLICLQHYFS